MTGKGISVLYSGLVALIPLFCAGAAPAQGTGLFTPPEGCNAYLTVQSRSCVVTNHFVCPLIDPDHKFRTDFGEAGPFYTSRIDADAQWINSGPPSAPQQTRTAEPITDPGSVTELIDTGIDSFDFYQTSPDDGRTRVTGYDRIIDEVVIDGERLFRTEFELTRRDETGRVIEHVVGREYVSDRHRRFFAGYAADLVDGAERNARDLSPVEFFYPGEPGFGATYPRYDCDLMSALWHREPVA